MKKKKRSVIIELWLGLGITMNSKEMFQSLKIIPTQNIGPVLQVPIVSIVGMMTNEH